MAPPRTSFFHLLFSCFLLAATTTRRSDGAGAPQLQAIDCSTEGNYTATDAYTANLNQLLAALPITTVSKNGGFFNGTVGQGAATVVYGLAMCSADFSRPDCTDCLTAASSNGTGLLKRCPGSVTASIMFDQCMIRYSNRSFFGTAETDIAVSLTSSEIVASTLAYSNNLKQGLVYLSAQAAMSPERFAASSTAPFALVQCTWDLPPDKCKACIDTLSANASNLFEVRTEGERKSYSCRVRYSNTSFTVVPLVAPTVNQSSSVNHDHPIGPPSSAATKSNKAIIAGAVTGTLVVVGSTMTMILVFFYVTRKRRYIKGLRVMPLDLLREITDHFSEQRKLGTGAYGIVYKGVQKGGKKIAVKVLHSTPERLEYVDEDFWMELKNLSMLKHPNIIRLLGYCHETKQEQGIHEGKPTTVHKTDRALCFEYMKGSLQEKLQEGDKLKWQDRYNIIKGTCKGLKYLHTGLKSPIFHLDLKPSNILLDKNMVPKIADFGLSKLVGGVTQDTTLSGTKGYRPPEYIKDSLVSDKYDIFSLGVVMLEIIAGKGYSNIAEDQMPSEEFIHTAEENWKKRLQETQHQTQVKRCIEIALACVHREPTQRPDIARITSLLNETENNTEQLATTFTSDTASLLLKK